MKWTEGNLLVTIAMVFGGFGVAASASSSVFEERRGRVGAQRPRRKVRVVLGEARNAERVVDEDLVVALRDAHRRKDRAGRVRPHQQVDLVDRDELLVERARELGLRLVVLDDPLDRAAEQTVLLVDLLDVDFADELMDERRGRERPGERQRAADADRRTRRCARRGADRDGDGAHEREEDRGNMANSAIHEGLLAVS